MEHQPLTEEEFQKTFVPPMLDCTDNAEEVVDLWNYAEPALKETWPEVCSCDFKVKHIYESNDGQWQHVFIPVHLSNVYFVVVIDKKAKHVIGHHVLNLGEKYGVGQCT